MIDLYKKSREKFILFFVFLILFCRLAYSDVAPEPITGGVTISPQTDKEAQIILLNEEVYVDIWKDKIKVTANFTLHNTEDKKTLVVGFPYSYEDELKDFAVKINNQESLVREDKVIKKDDYIKGKEYTTYWKIWDMSFAKDESKEVEIRYSSIPKHYVHEMTFSDLSLWYKGEEKESIENKLKRFDVRYILTTGAAWKGKISKATIKFRLHEISTEQIEEYLPNNGSITQEEIEWVFEDFEPKENIRVTILPNIKKSQIINLYEETFTRHPEDPFVAENLGRMHKERGEVDKALNIYKRFLLPANEVPKLFAKDRTNYESGRSACIWRMCNFIIDHVDNLDVKERKACVQKALPVYQKFLNEITNNERTWGAKENTIEGLRKYIQKCNDLLLTN